MKDLRRVFYHELGHFVAHELDKRYFGGPGTKSIELYHDPHNRDIWGGNAKVNLSEGEKEKNVPFKERIAEYLATSTYGCMFECYLLNQPLTECFKIGGHGQKDGEQWHNVLVSYKIFDYRKGIIQADDDYLKMLLENNFLAEFMKLNPDEFLEAYGTGYLVKMENLRAAVSDLVDVHAAEFKKLIEQYRASLADAFKQLEHSNQKE